MTTHYESELQDAVDGRLDATGRREVEAHVAVCASCRTTYERLRWVKEALAVAGESEDVPPKLGARIRSALDQEDRIADAPVGVAPRPRWRARWVAALAAGVLVIAGVTLLTRSRPNRQDVIVAVAEDFDRFRSGASVPDLATDDGERLRSFFAAAALGFDVRVLDLSMMGYRIVGGGLETVGNRHVALLVYRADPDRVVLCAMYLGDAAAGAGGEVREHAGITFHVHRLAGRTVVVWQEGRVTCALVSDGEPDDVFQLAIAKAMKAA